MITEGGAGFGPRLFRCGAANSALLAPCPREIAISQITDYAPDVAPAE
jgi:hypothetical protein